MSFVKNHIVPWLALETPRVFTRQTVRRHADVEFVTTIPALSKFFASFGVTMITQDLEAGEELLELHLPVKKDTGWHDDEMRAPYAAVASKVSK